MPKKNCVAPLPTSLFLSLPRISVTHFASPDMPLDAPGHNYYIINYVALWWLFIDTEVDDLE